MEGLAIEGDQLVGEYQMELVVNCSVGYITHPSGGQYLTADNYRTVGLTSYKTTCNSDNSGEHWSTTLDCVSK